MRKVISIVSRSRFMMAQRLNKFILRVNGNPLLDDTGTRINIAGKPTFELYVLGDFTNKAILDGTGIPARTEIRLMIEGTSSMPRPYRHPRMNIG